MHLQCVWRLRSIKKSNLLNVSIFWLGEHSWWLNQPIWKIFLQIGSWNPKDRGEKKKTFLIGGFNPVEKYESNWESSPGRGENSKNLWNHQPDLSCHHQPRRSFDHSDVVTKKKITGRPPLLRYSSSLRRVSKRSAPNAPGTLWKSTLGTPIYKPWKGHLEGRSKTQLGGLPVTIVAIVLTNWDDPSRGPPRFCQKIVIKGFLRDNDGTVHKSLDKVCGGGFSWHWAGVGVLRFPMNQGESWWAGHKKVSDEFWALIIPLKSPMDRGILT